VILIIFGMQAQLQQLYVNCRKKPCLLTHYRSTNQGMGRRGLDSGGQVLQWYT